MPTPDSGLTYANFPPSKTIVELRHDEVV